MERHRLASIAAGGLVGLSLAGAFAIPSILPPAMAQEEPARTLLKSADEIFPEPMAEFFKPEWTVEDYVSTEVISRQTVRKIGYGRTEFVDIVTTASGTYSSDAVNSPYVLYPGIHDTQPVATAAGFGLLGLWDGDSWTVLKSFGAGSFVDIVPFDGGKTLVHEGGACVMLDNDSVYC